MDLAEVLRLGGRVAEAVPLVSRALDHYEQKEHLVKAKQAGTARRNLSPAALPADAPGYSLNN